MLELVLKTLLLTSFHEGGPGKIFLTSDLLDLIVFDAPEPLVVSVWRKTFTFDDFLPEWPPDHFKHHGLFQKKKKIFQKKKFFSKKKKNFFQKK